MSKNFINTQEMSGDELEQLLDAAARFKRGEDTSKPLTGKVRRPGVFQSEFAHARIDAGRQFINSAAMQ